MRWALVFLFADGSLLGQDAALARLVLEAERAKASSESSAERPAAKVAALHVALREWIESRLPKNKERLAVEYSYLQASMRGQLDGAGLSEAVDPHPDYGGREFPGFGFVGIQIHQMPELPDSIVVIAATAVGCGDDEAVYVYRFDRSGWKLTLKDHPASAWGWGETELALSEPDPLGRRLLLIHRLSVQCASTWMGIAYSVYRVGFPPGASESLLAGEHGFWIGNYEAQFVLKPEELIIEFQDQSVDGGVHNRTELDRYAFGAKDMTRLDPVAFQPQDFAEEWLTRPWSEMQSRSKPKTEEWHSKLHGDFLFADYSAVVPCRDRPDHWMIALTVRQIGEKELSTPLATYFLVHDLGNYHYEMEAVSGSRPTGCEGAGDASDKHPWLSVDELKALR
jgi:hypothetical protein